MKDPLKNPMGKNLRVLLVEDSEDDALLILRALRKAGYETAYERVETPEAMNCALRGKSWDIVLSDYSMPHFNGMDALRLLRKNDSQLPFIIVSGAIGEETAVELMRIGAQDCVMKDKLSRLVPAVERELAQAQIRKEREQALQLLQWEVRLNATLAELSRKIISVSDNLESIARVVLDKAKELTGSQHGYVAIVDPRSRNLVPLTFTEMRKDVCKVREGMEKISFALGEGGVYNGLLGHALNTKRPFYVNEPQTHPASVGVPDGHIPLEKFLTVPGVADNILVGQIALANPGRDYTDHDLLIIQRLADLYSLAIIRQFNRREREQLAAQLRQAQKMEAIGTLAGGIAHDFNNILTPIIGYAELVQDGLPSDSENAEHLQQVLQAAGRARDLVKQILAFSRKGGHERSPQQIHLIVKESLKLLRATIPTTIEIRQDIDPHSGMVLSDPTQIHQIILNLCTNAYQAMRSGSGMLALSLHSVHIDWDDGKVKSFDLTPGPYVLLEVSDTGTGMDKQTMERIFEPYFTTKAQGEGTGLGLSVVHGIMKSYGGHISVYSEPGKGSTFRLYFPELLTEPAAETVKSPESYPGGRERALVVDDEETIVKMGARMLESLGYQVAAFSDSGDALKRFREAPADFDFIVTDMTMPGLTGVELSQQIHAIRPDIPIILCTGFSELINKKNAKALGVQEYLMKPVVKRDLAIAIRKVLDEPTPKPS